MHISFGVRVVDADGNGVESAEVAVHYPYGVDSNYTDGDGWVRFGKWNAFGDAVRTTIYVNGVIRESGIWIEDENTFSFALERDESPSP